MNIQNTDPGIKTVGKLYRDMQIDTEWSLLSERGFTWWGQHYAQRIWADEPFESQGLLVTRVNAETDFLKYSERSAKTEDMLAAGMMYASLSGPVIYQETGCIKLRCSLFIHEENQAWLTALFSLAAIMQYCEVAFKAEELASILGLEPDKSAHPTSGCRPKMDEMLNFLDYLTIPEGQEPLEQITDEGFQNIAEEFSEYGLSFLANEGGLSKYLPFGNETALLQVKTREEHPSLGKGMLFLLSLPPEEIAEAVELAGPLILALNAQEQESSETGHFLGSWCLGPGRGEHKLTPVFVTFLPALACTPTVIINMVFSTLAHCHLAEKVFHHDYPSLLEQANSCRRVGFTIFDESGPDTTDMDIAEPSPQQGGSGAKIERDKIEPTIIYHIIEDICPTCPIEALRTIDFDTNLKTCDAQEHSGNCGVAELRAKYS